MACDLALWAADILWMDESLRGKLLIASPALVDPNFARSVVLMTEHSEDGAMGIVLNRPATRARAS